MIKLRPYQNDAEARVWDAWKRGVRAPLLVMPTGSGKTRTFASIMHNHGGCCGAVVHRKEIVVQISEALADLGLKHRIIAPPKVIARARRKHLKKHGKQFIDANAKAGVISVQTLTSQASTKDRTLQDWLHQVTLMVYDEGHHYVTRGFWAKAVDCVPEANLLFVTASPERADGTGLGDGFGGFAQEMIQPVDPETGEVVDTAWLIKQGFLSTFKYKAPPTNINVTDIPLTASGELNAKALRAREVESTLIGDAVAQYREFAPGKSAIVFASCIETAEDLERAFLADGWTAKQLSGETDAGERDRAIDDFEQGKLQVLINVDLFDEGFDVPGAVVAILTRRTESLAKYLQMCGRVLRIAEGKEHAVIIDPVRNWEVHGLPNWPRAWSLEGRKRGSGKPSDTVPQRICLNRDCLSPYEAFYRACPYCGTVPTPVERSAPEKVDGVLVDLDLEAYDALFAKFRAANLSREDYAVTQIQRGIPPIGRGADMRRHSAALTRRGVLEHLVGWWWGSQPADRTDAEKQSRFYHRFGYDLLTAFTLSAEDTDALISLIQSRFHLDLRDGAALK